MPGRGAQRGWYSATRLTTEAGKFLSPKVGVGVANRYRSMLSELADRGGLRCVGEGRLFSRFDELMEYINNPRVVREAKMQRPVTIGVTMFKGERNFNQFLEGLKAA